MATAVAAPARVGGWAVRNEGDTLHIRSTWATLPFYLFWGNFYLYLGICGQYSLMGGVVALVALLVSDISASQLATDFVEIALKSAAPLLLRVGFVLFGEMVTLGRTLRVSPSRWHATTGSLCWKRRAEGDARDLLIQVSKHINPVEGFYARLFFGKRRWHHSVQLRTHNAPSHYINLWDVPREEEDFAEVNWLSETIRKHVQLSEEQMGKQQQLDYSKPGSLTPRRPPLATVHHSGNCCCVELPFAYWQAYQNATMTLLGVSLLFFPVTLLCGKVLLAEYRVNGFDSWTVLATINWASGFLIAAFTIGLAAFSVHRALLYTSPRILKLGPESYSMTIGWRWLPLVQRRGNTINLRAEAVGPKDNISVHILKLKEVGVPGEVVFWAPICVGDGAWTYNFREEVAKLATVVSQYVNDLAEHTKPEDTFVVAE